MASKAKPTAKPVAKPAAKSASPTPRKKSPLRAPTTVESAPAPASPKQRPLRAKKPAPSTRAASPARKRRQPMSVPIPLPDPDWQYDDSVPPIWDVIVELGMTIPDEELAAIPKDFARNLDHYLHGAPRVEDDE